MNYSLSFTAGALLYDESLSLILSIEDFDKYFEGDYNLDNNALNTNSESSRKRLKSEIDKRLKNVGFDYLHNFLQFTEQDQKVILFLAICKTYSIITEFALEVVYNKWINFDNDLTTYDFKYFLSAKLSEEQLNTVSSHSLYKLTQVAVKIFKDVGIFDGNKLSTIPISESLIDLLKKKGDLWFLPCILNPNIEEAE